STFSDNLKIIDDKKIIVGNGDGSGNDLEIFHQSSNNYSYIKSPQKGLFIQNAGMNATYVSANYLNLTNSNASETYATFNINGLSLNYKGQTKFQTATSGINVVGTTTTGQLAVTGVSTFTGAIDANGDLDVDGHTNLDNVSIAGVTTFTGNIGGTATFNDIDVDGHTNLDNVSIAGVTSVASLTSGRVVTVGTAGKLQDSSNLTFDGSNLFVSGINITGGGATSILGADIVTRNLKATGLSTFVGQSEFDGNAK
ncbi:MAG: hypothetical protein VXY93_14930, partial [Pseudomonadota bacterium]|nr:hypothetical protein [Pseudomonadota bacterium]